MLKTLGAVTIAAALLAPIPPAQASSHVPEGRDLRHCVTTHEFDAVPNGARRAVVRKVWDTRGTVVGKRALEKNAGGFMQMLGLHKDDIESAPMRHRLVKRYPACDEPDTVVLVEYRTWGSRDQYARWVQMVWN